MSVENPLAPLLADLPAARDCLGDYLIAHAATNGSDTACVEGTRSLSYVDLANEVARQAALLTHLGVIRGDRVAALVPPSIDFLVSFLATTSLGAVWLGLNPKHTRAELQYVLRDADPRVLFARSRIAGRDYLDDLRALPTSSLHLALLDERAHADDFTSVDSLLAGLEPREGSTIPSGARPEDPALLVYTSGTTGAPKGALLSHRALIRAALVRSHAWRVRPMRSLNNAPVSHVGGAGDIACTTLIAGGCQVFQEKFDPGAALELLERERISYWYQAPTMFQLCMEHPRARSLDWSHLQAAIWSGGRPSQELIAQLTRIAPQVAVDYSMTESVGAITLTPLMKSLASVGDTVGWPDPGRCIRVVDPQHLTAAADGEAGEVQLRDAFMFSGYRNAGTDASARTTDGWFRTGDLAVRAADGSLRITGRLKEMFKSGGYNVYPKEVEQVIESHAAVSAAAVVPAPDALYGEAGIAFVVLKERATATAADLALHCRATLANYKVPKQFFILTELPLLPIGKVDRTALRTWAQELKATGATQ